MLKDVDTSEEVTVYQTVLTVKQLLPYSKNGFASWWRVAKEQMGSEQYADMLSSLATMPKWKQYFVSGDKGVKLTDEGYN